MGRQSCSIVEQQKMRKGLWSPEEDEKLYNYITTFGLGCWSSVPKLAGLQRCGKSCRLRWMNYLRPHLKRGMFTQQEEDLIINLHEALGNRWAQIATQLPGRTDNEIKNLWNSSLKKKLIKQGIDPNTHKPITQTQDSILQTQGLSNPSSPTRVETFATKQVYDDPLFLSEFQDTTDHHGFHSKFPFHFQQNPTVQINPSCGLNSSMPNLMEADYSDSSASRISAYMMNEVKESSSSSTFSWEAENKLRNKCLSDESLFFSGIHTEESSADFDNNPFTLFSEEFFQQM